VSKENDKLNRKSIGGITDFPSNYLIPWMKTQFIQRNLLTFTDYSKSGEFVADFARELVWNIVNKVTER
jgi:hypothetical protein